MSNKSQWLHNSPKKFWDDQMDETLASIRSLANLLTAVVTSTKKVPDNVIEILRTALSTQSGMTKLDLPDYEIRPRSLNAIKNRANRAIEGGFGTLDQLRRQALATLKENAEREHRPSRGTKAELLVRLRKEEERADCLHNEIAVMSEKLKDYIELCQKYAESADELDDFERKQRELLGKYRFLPEREVRRGTKAV